MRLLFLLGLFLLSSCSDRCALWPRIINSDHGVDSYHGRAGPDGGALENRCVF